MAIFKFNLIGCMRRIRQRLFDRNIIVRGRCIQCGRCCRRICLHLDGSWVTSVRFFRRYARENLEYGRFQVIGRDESGYLEFACNHLRKDGSCWDYARRLDICREYPHKDLWFTGGVLLRDCGYMLEEIPSFEKILKSPSKT